MWEIPGNGTLPEMKYLYTTNAEEADMRIWRHACQAKACRILTYYPDTDVYNNIINPWRMRPRVTVIGLCVCVCVSLLQVYTLLTR